MDYAELQRKYGGQFVAMRGDEVVAAAKTHGDLVRELDARGVNVTQVVFEFVRRKDRVYALRVPPRPLRRPLRQCPPPDRPGEHRLTRNRLPQSF
jgi:hypothetical protein